MTDILSCYAQSLYITSTVYSDCNRFINVSFCCYEA